MELFNGPVKFFTGVSFEHFNQTFVAVSPGSFILIVVVPLRDGGSYFIIQGHLSYLCAVSPVGFVTETRMINFLNAIAFT